MPRLEKGFLGGETQLGLQRKQELQQQDRVRNGRFTESRNFRVWKGLREVWPVCGSRWRLEERRAGARSKTLYSF